MPVAEAAGRVKYRILLALERRRIASHATDAGVRAGRAMAAVYGPSRPRRARPAFFAGLEHPGELRRLFSADGPYALQAEQARRAAAAAERHEFEFFGQRFAYGSRIDWHADPVTGRRWPRVFHADVPIHHDDGSIGDVKYVWELNRHQFLIDLGKAYWLFGDNMAASSVYRLVRDWIDANPYGMGVNWSCALEPAFRVWSWLWAYHFCARDPRLDDETRARWLSSFHDHGAFLYRHLEYYSSPYNHLIGEASALYALGVLFPELPGAGRWRRRGRRVLEQHVKAEFHEDGGSVEQSTFYHHATLGFYILAALLAEANGDPLSPDVDRAIETGIHFSMSLMQPDGRLPSIGGADDGKSIRLEHLPFWDFRPFQAIGAARYARGDFRFAAGEFLEDALWLTGPAGRERFLGLTPRAPVSSVSLRSSGYTVLRNGWARDGDYVCFDCGEQAAGLRRDNVPSAAHGHADCLSVVVWLRGRPILVDPGFYCYNGDPAWEVAFRRTGAHNTARVDRADQSRHVHKMAWSHVFTPRLEAPLAADRYGAAGGSHDGYARLAGGVVHRRAVWLHQSGVIICDQFTGVGPHEIEITCQFAPGTAALSGNSAVLFDDAELVWAVSERSEAVLRCGEPGPDGGWIAPSLGIKAPAPRLTLRSHLVGPVTTCLTGVFPRSGASPRHSVVRSGDSHLAVGIQEAGGTHWFGIPASRAAGSAAELIASLTVWREDATKPACRPAVLEQLS